MKGFDKNSKEWKAIYAFVEKAEHTDDKVDIKDLPDHAKTLTMIAEDYSRGFIACEMVRAKKEINALKEGN